MNTVMLLSGLAAPVVVALVGSRSRRGRRALRRVVMWYCLLNLAYLGALMTLFRGLP